jgi:hypothetical protein
MGYEVCEHRTYKINDEGERAMLANFEANITKETRYLDGTTVDSFLEITGKQRGPNKQTIDLPPVTVKSDNFASMSWVLAAWGVRAVITPGNMVKDDLRAAIQLSSTPDLKIVYKHLGWEETPTGPMYLHARGAIKQDGNDPTIAVSVPHDLSRYVLPDPPTTRAELRTAVQAVIDLTTLAPPPVAWTLLAATITPTHGPVDFAVHLTGRTGTFKSELMSLFQSFYGPEMDARHLPGSWSSTANALEAQAHIAANAAFVIDDFVPAGTSWQVRSYQTTADKLIRAQGNQAGRARLTDTSNLQQTMYPRGIILSTGEDTPDGHSVRARLMILEMTPGDIEPKSLSHAQKQRQEYSKAMAAYIQQLSKNPPTELTRKTIAQRDKHLDLGHTRTPAMVARLIESVDLFLQWACNIIGKGKYDVLKKEAYTAIRKCGSEQLQYLESADPLDIFASALRTILATGLGHVRTTNGGIPRDAETLGWTVIDSAGDIPTYKSRGPCIGWVAWQANEILLDANAGYPLVRKVAGADISLSRNTFLKRLKDGGLITRSDTARQRNTIRVSAENHPRQVIALTLSKILDTQEVPGDTKPAKPSN